MLLSLTQCFYLTIVIFAFFIAVEILIRSHYKKKPIVKNPKLNPTDNTNDSLIVSTNAYENRFLNAQCHNCGIGLDQNSMIFCKKCQGYK